MGTKHFSRVCLAVLSVIALGAIAGLIGCTQAVNQNASISITLPDSSRSLRAGRVATTYQLSHVAINVTGSGISSPIFLGWDAHNQNSVAPASFDLSVPGGTARLVQVIAVYNGGGGDDFYYGDTTQDITAETTVSVAVSSISAGTVLEGSIGGQYVTASGTNPSGTITAMYTPPVLKGAAAKPAMEIFAMDIFNGYFEVFAIGGGTAAAPVGFNYVLADGTDLFGQVMDIAVYTPAAASTQQVKVSMPASWNEDCNGGNCNSSNAVYSYNPASWGIFGYFGPGAATDPNTICYPPSNSNGHNWCATSPTPVPTSSPTEGQISWGASTGGTCVAYASTGGVQDAVNTTDGQNLCAPGSSTRFTNFLSVDVSNLNNNQRTLGFYGPYLTYSTGGGGNNMSALNVSMGTTSMTLSYTYLPGAQAAGVQSDVFFRILPSGYPNPQDFQDDVSGANCALLTTLSSIVPAPIPSPTGTEAAPAAVPVINFIQLAPTNSEIPATAATPMPNQNISVNIPAAAQAAIVNGGSPQIILCPRIGTTYYDDAGEYGNNTGGGGGGPSPATSFQLANNLGQLQNLIDNSDAAQIPLLNNDCVPLFITGMNGSSPAPLWSVNPSNLSVTFSALGASTYYGGDSTCTNVMTPQMMPGNGSAPIVIYVKTDPSTQYSGSITISDSADGMTPLTAFAGLHNEVSPTYFVSLNVPATINQFGCYPIYLAEIMSCAGNNYMAPSINTGLSVSLATPTGVAYYQDPSCTQSTTPSTQIFGTNQVFIGSNLYFSYTGTTGSTSLNLAATISPSETAMSSMVTTVNPPNAPTQLNLQLQNNVEQGQCTPFMVQIQDNLSNPVPASTTATVNIGIQSGGVGLLYPTGDSACTGGSTSESITIAAGQTFGTGYYMSSTTSAGTTVNASISSPFSFTTSPNVTVSPAPTLSIVPLTTAGGTSAQFVVLLSVSSMSPVTFNYSTANGTATQPTDYTSISGTATINPGMTSYTLPPITTTAALATGLTFSIDLTAITGTANPSASQTCTGL